MIKSVSSKGTRTDAKEGKNTDTNEVKLFWSKIWEWKEHNRKAKWINNMEKELHGLEEGLVDNTPGIAQNNTQKVPNSKALGHDGIHSL